MDRHQKFGIILIPNLVLHKKPYVRKIRQPLVSSFRRTMINRPTVGAAAAAFAGLAAAASITNSIPLAQAFVVPPPPAGGAPPDMTPTQGVHKISSHGPDSMPSRSQIDNNSMSRSDHGRTTRGFTGRSGSNLVNAGGAMDSEDYKPNVSLVYALDEEKTKKIITAAFEYDFSS